MAANKLAIYNMALVRLGEAELAAVDADQNSRRLLDVIFDDVLKEVTQDGPEGGWKFARIRTNVEVAETDITAFTDYNATVADTTQVTAADHGFTDGEMVNIADTTNYNGDYVAHYIDEDNFYIDVEYVADDATGTLTWTSEEYAYRFAVPTCLQLLSVQSGGVELTDWVREGDYVLTNLEDEDVDMIYVKSVTTTTLFPAYFTKVLVLSLALELAYNLIQSATMAERIRTELEQIVKPWAKAMDNRETYVKEYSNSWIDAGR